jgi:hypothetical protein
MKKIKILLTVCITIAMLTVPVNAQMKKVAQAGLQFLKIDMSARAAAMGGSYIMVNNDASSMFYNPAGLAKMESRWDFNVIRTQWIADISYLGGAVAYNMDNWGTVGVSFMTADYGNDIIGTRYANNEQGFVETGNLSVGAYTVGLTYAKALTDKFTIGGQVKYAYQHLGENYIDTTGALQKNEVSGLAFDFGTIFYPGWKSLRLGMSVRNFSPEFKYYEDGFELPLTFTIGAAMDILDIVGPHDNPLLVSVDAVHPRDYADRIHVGVEYSFMKMVHIRTGYKFNYDNEGFTAGLGVQQNIAGISVKIDYAYSTMKYFDGIHRIAFGFSY